MKQTPSVVQDVEVSRSMTTKEVKPGAVVELKSGGPRMTVHWVEHGKAWCQWFSGVEVRGEKFAIAMLRVVDDETADSTTRDTRANGR